MGTFEGHVVLGSFFIFAGVWWLMQMLRRYFSCQNNNSIFVSSATKMLFQQYRTAAYEPLESNLHGDQRNAI
jgi:hypothetical protein